MDALKSFIEKEAGGNQQNQNNQQQSNENNNQQQQQQQQQSQGGGNNLLNSLGALASGKGNGEGGNNILNSLNSMAGGGKDSEKNEDYLDKGVDAVQQYVLKQGDQSNESAVEQAKDEQISDFIRTQYKNTTGKDFFIKDKDTNLGL